MNDLGGNSGSTAFAAAPSSAGPGPAGGGSENAKFASAGSINGTRASSDHAIEARSVFTEQIVDHRGRSRRPAGARADHALGSRRSGRGAVHRVVLRPAPDQFRARVGGEDLLPAVMPLEWRSAPRGRSVRLVVEARLPVDEGSSSIAGRTNDAAGPCAGRADRRRRCSSRRTARRRLRRRAPPSRPPRRASRRGRSAGPTSSANGSSMASASAGRSSAASGRSTSSRCRVP